MRRAAGVAIALVLAAGLLVTAAAPAQAAGRACGTLPIDYQRLPDEHYSRMHVVVKRGGVPCRRARRVMRRYQRNTKCDNRGNTCMRKYRDGWTCWAPTQASYPRIQGCERGRSLIEGRVRRGEAD